MDKHHRTPTYYRIRTAVRIGFWGSLALVAGVLVWNGIDEPTGTDCDLVVNDDFTWDKAGYEALHGDKDPNTCSDLGEPIVLNSDGSWDWRNPDYP